MGLLAELIMRVYYESQSKADYRIKSLLNPRQNDTALPASTRRTLD
jgi:hypothetical protein